MMGVRGVAEVFDFNNGNPALSILGSQIQIPNSKIQILHFPQFAILNLYFYSHSIVAGGLLVTS